MGATERVSGLIRRAVASVRGALPGEGPEPEAPDEAADRQPRIDDGEEPAAPVAPPATPTPAAEPPAPPVPDASARPASDGEGQPEPPAPWSQAVVEQFRAALDAEVERLQDELRAGQADLAHLIERSGDGAGDDQVDSGAATFEREHEMAVNVQLAGMLDQALRARDRLEAGSYGVCESCGKPIAAARLRAFPRATLCISCKQAEERR